ncbi:MAG: hypothetical protein K8F59_05855 [Rhodobacteraceae bacterium]|nr:hypothetical protein [Paracoccaceae bacterium]
MKYKNMPDDPIAFEIVMDDSEGNVLVLDVVMAAGRLSVMAEFELEGRRLFAKGMHVHAEGFSPNDLGWKLLRKIAESALERLDYEELIVEGAVRTTGASPGRLPKRLRFKRARRNSGEAGF